MVADSLFEDFASADFANRKRSVAVNQQQHKLGPYNPRVPEGRFGDMRLSYSKVYSAFGNAVLTQACKTSNEHGLVFRNDAITDIYSRTPFNSKLRAWIVDEWIWQYDSEGVADLEFQDCMSLFGGFVFEVMKAQARRIGKKAKVSLSCLCVL